MSYLPGRLAEERPPAPLAGAGLLGGASDIRFGPYRSGDSVPPLRVSSAAPVPFPAPLPFPLPPVAIPGTKENQEFENQVVSLYRMLRKLLSPEEEEGCNEEWKAAVKYCKEIARKNAFKGGKSVTGADFDQCVRGQVSERCGGNPVEYRDETWDKWR